MPKRRESPASRVNPSGKRVWVARYTGPDGRRHSAGTFTTKREAQDAIDRAHRAPVRRDTVGAYFGGRERDGRDDGSDWTDRLPRSERTDRTNRGRIRAVLDVRIEGRALRDWPLTELRRRLSMAVHESLVQRIVVRYHLGGLARDELPQYLDHRLRLAGTSLPLFEPAAVQALYQSTHGMPRKVNRIAHYALSAAALAKARQITAEHVQSAVEEVQ